MDITILLKAGVLLVGGIACVSLLKLALTIFRSDKSEYEINRSRSGSFFDPILGRVKTAHDGYRDFRVQAGLAVNTKSNEWVEQGVLSEESVDMILK